MTWAIDEKGYIATAGLPACWPAAEDLSLCLDTAGRWTVADQVERIGFATAPLRLPSLGAAIGPARGCGSITRSFIGSTRRSA